VECHVYDRSQLKFQDLRISGFAAFLFVAAAASPAGADDQKWEVEVHAGGAFDSAPGGGEVRLPDPNSLVSSPGPQSARIVPSWFFGDGALQFNQALASLFQFGSIIPLDDVLRSPFAERQAGGSFGVRVSRALTPRFSAEFSFDRANDRLALTSRSLIGVEVSRLTFLNAWNSFFPIRAGPTQTVSSVATIDDSRGRQVTGTGSLLVNLVNRGPLIPYAAVGAGVIANTGGAPSARLVGNYGFVFETPIPGIPTFVINDTDTVAVRAVVDDKQFTFVIGGGFKYPVGKRLGVRVDVRDHIHGNSQRTELDAMPSTLSGAGSVTFGMPRLSFGSSLFARPTLSGPPISNFVTFRGSGTEHQINLSGGVFWRF
jgi:hypothetical protein